MCEKKLICSLDVVEELLMSCLWIPELCYKAAGCGMLLLRLLETIDMDAGLYLTDALKIASDGTLSGDKLVL